MRSNPKFISASELPTAEYIADRVKSAYQSLSIDSLAELETLYTEDVHFEDPAHALQGRKQLMDYFTSLFSNLESCSFKFHQTLIGNTDFFMSWTMFIEHPKLRNGVKIRVEGGSLFKTRRGQIYYHRDYFDMGAMIYEHLPILGRAVRKIKQRLGQ